MEKVYGSQLAWVPVVDINDVTLMPCHPFRASELIRKGKALKKFKAGMIFYIKLNYSVKPNNQAMSIGIDPGSKKEGFTVSSAKHNIINIQSNAITDVKDKLKARSDTRRAKRFRNTPCRKNRLNRASLRKNRIPPSTFARWNNKLRIVKILMQLFPITSIGVEDVSASTKKGKKKNKKWNASFSPLEVGKTWFYQELKHLVKDVVVHSGTTTSRLRKEADLSKTKNKMSNSFDAHCVDSYVSSMIALGVLDNIPKPATEQIILMNSLRFPKRQLHVMQPAKNNIRKRYGGTNSLGFRKGSLVKHTKYGIMLVGGWQEIANPTKKEPKRILKQLTLLDRGTAERGPRTVKPEDCTFLSYNSWSVKYVF